MKLKRSAAIICIILFTGSSNIYTEAAVISNIIQPYYTTILNATAKITNTDGLFTVQTQITAKQKSDLSITMKLQKKSGTSWVTVKTWTESKADAVLLKISKTYTVSKGTYRISSSVSAGSETATVNSTTVTY